MCVYVMKMLYDKTYVFLKFMGGASARSLTYRLQNGEFPFGYLFLRKCSKKETMEGTYHIPLIHLYTRFSLFWGSSRLNQYALRGGGLGRVQLCAVMLNSNMYAVSFCLTWRKHCSCTLS